jgi:hypothetical protein
VALSDEDKKEPLEVITADSTHAKIWDLASSDVSYVRGYF